MRLAIIYWPTSSVGGIGTHSRQLVQAGRSLGHTVDVLVSASQRTKRAGLFAEPQWIRGGDTKIWVEGQAPHHPDNVGDTIKWLEEHYDALYFVYLCPHQIKAYPDPDFMPLYTECKLPKAAGITDAYWDDYKHWGELCLPHVRKCFVVCDAYAQPLIDAGYDKITRSRQPFFDVLGGERGDKEVVPTLMWMNQWKAVKGTKKFLSIVPEIPSDVGVELYSCGIEYYQLRYEDVWDRAVGKDFFMSFNGSGRARYYGNLEHREMMKKLCGAWWTVNLQGHAAKHKAYLNGGYNFTEVESLYYGALPIVHANTEKSIIPSELYVSVEHESQIPEVVDTTRKLALDPDRQQAAREWVLREHSAQKVFQEIIDVLK